MPKRIAPHALVAATVLLAAASAEAGVWQPAASSFAVLSGGRLSTDAGVSVEGVAGALDAVWLGAGTGITDGLLSRAGVGGDQGIVLGGPVVAGGPVWFDRDAHVDSIHSTGSVGLARDVRVDGHVVAGTRLDVDRDTVIGGDASYGTGFWVDSRATVGGTLGPGIHSVDTWDPAFRHAPTLAPTGQGSEYRGRGTDTALDPAAYGRVSVDRDATVRLATGTYALDSLWVGRDSTLVIDTAAGDVVVNVAGTLSTDRGVRIERIGDGAVTFHAGGSVYLGRATEADASFLTLAGLQVDRDSVIDGWIQSEGNLWLGRDTEVLGAGTGLPGMGQPIPEPGTIGLLLVGSMGAFMLRPRPWRRGSRRRTS